MISKELSGSSKQCGLAYLYKAKDNLFVDVSCFELIRQQRYVWKLFILDNEMDQLIHKGWYATYCELKAHVDEYL